MLTVSLMPHHWCLTLMHSMFTKKTYTKTWFYFIKRTQVQHRRYFLISFQRSIISIRQFPKIAAIIQFLNRQWNNKFCNFKERFNPLEYCFRCNTKRNRIFTTIQRYASLTWQRSFVLLMILNLMFFYWNIYFCFHM